MKPLQRFKLFFFIINIVLAGGISHKTLAWSEAGHEQITEFGLMDVAKKFDLFKPVKVTPLQPFLSKLFAEVAHTPEGPISKDPAGLWFREFLKTSPQIPLDTYSAIEKKGARTTPFQILIDHSSDPDDGRDQNLSVHKYQKYFGGTTGPSSQAFRHMEKPAFNVFNFRSTLGLPLRKAGEASQRALLYFNLARLAKNYHEDYWMWRFLACSYHYLEDLAQPYHTTEISSHGRLWKQARHIQLRWHTGLSLSDIMSRLVTNSHDWFETYTSTLMEQNRAFYFKNNTVFLNPQTKQLYEALRGTSVDYTQGNIRDYAVQIRNDSNKKSPDLLEAAFMLGDDRLRGLFVYDQEAIIKPNPLDFLNPVQDEEFDKYQQKFFQLVKESFALSGESLRTALDELQIPREPKTNKELIEEIRQLR
ncbi:MAG: hypothetical protein ACD_73C00260G0001 [uncultured bacterium]|nr:MAG: hypothetical protein ACD_73C00260G0001 [uncultured bacterium]